MNKPTKITLLALLFILALPMRHFAQTPYRQYADNGILLDFLQIDDVNFRACLLYNLNQDDRFILLQNEEWGQFSVSSNDNSDITNFFDAFEAFYNNTYADFLLLSKNDIDDRMTNWKNSIPDVQFLSMMMDTFMRNNRPTNNHCVDSDPFCTSDVITFDAATSDQTADQLEGTTLQDGCIGSSYSPAWYHMRIQTGGQFIIHAEGHDPNNSSVTRDIDFCMWGPYTDPTSPCVAQLTTNMIIDCCFSASYSENIYLGYPEGQHSHGGSGHGTITEHTPAVGEYYILMITNYSRQPCTISFSKTTGSGPGETDCGILPGIVTNDGPYCVGETIHLSVNSQDGASYSWTGPNGYSSNQQNPTRPNCTLNMAGIYTCTTTIGTQSTSDTTNVVIYPMPNANFTFTTVCQGEATQFTNTSTTNPAGQQISSYQWNFGDGQTSTQQSPSHTYPNAGTFTVTLTVSTGGHCTSTKTQTVTVQTQPVANAGPDQTIPYGSVAQLNGSGGAGTFNYQWDPANMVVNPNAQNTQTVQLTQDQTYTLTVTNGSCTSTDEVTIHISGSAMTVTAGPDISICQGGSGQIYVSAGGGTGNLSYAWTPTTGLSNPNIYNPIASPSQTTTYTCHVTDGQTSQNVSVTVTVNDVIVENEYQSICPDETYPWHGTEYSNAGTYQFDTVTDQGCEKTIYLHLEHHPSYNENETTPIVVEICDGESYTFHAQGYNDTYTHSIITYYTLETINGCDSIVKLDLTVWPPVPTDTITAGICVGQTYNFHGTLYNQDGDIAYFDTIDYHGCPKVEMLMLSVGEYQMPPIEYQYICVPHDADHPSFIWDKNQVEYRTDTIAEAILPDLQGGGCDFKYRLNLRFHQEFYQVEDPVVRCDYYPWLLTGEVFDQEGTHTYIRNFPQGGGPNFNCDSTYVLNITINKSIVEPNPITIQGDCDSVPVTPWPGHETVYFNANTPPTGFTFTGETEDGCYREQTVHIQNMKYTPNPNKIKCSDASAVVYSVDPLDPYVDDTIAVVTNTEFFSFQYTFYVEETNSNCIWESCDWAISKPSWAIEFNPEPTLSLNGKYYSECTVYVADRQNEYVELTATINNGCGSKERKFYLKSSFLDIDEGSNTPAKVSIVPNPNNGQMHIDFENMEGRTAIKVFDMTGNQIDAFETNVNSSHYNYEYNMKKYAEGIYFFMIANNNRVLTKKVVVIH